MRRTGFLAAWVAAGLVAVLAFGGSPAYADPHGDKDKVDKELSQTQAALQDDTDEVTAAVAAYQEADRQLTIAQQRLADARGVLAGAEAREATTARVARTAQANLSVADQTLGVAQQKVDQSRDAIDDYSVGAYEGGDIAGVSALLSVTSPADFVAGLTYLDQVAEVQQSDLAASRTARIVARNQENVQAGAARTAADAEADAVAAVSQAATAEQDAAQESQQVTSLVAEKAAALKQAQSQRAATLARYQALQAESDRIAAEIRAQAHPGSPAATLRPGARLPMPVVGWKSSDFGMRYDPFYHVWQLHAGADFAAPEGTPIWAVEPGKVIQAGWDGGYGNYTCIYHGTYQGKAFATCYAHQSKILVSVGQEVRQGQVIGRVGTTGASTGDHLHFEVRLNGIPVDPVPWLPACLC